MKKCRETSKRLLVASWAAAITLTVVVAIGSFTGADMTNLTILAGSAWAELATTHAFYYWKAKNENRWKYAMQLVKDLAAEHGIENVINLANTILRD